MGSDANPLLTTTLDDIERDIAAHATTQQGFQAMFLCAMGSISDADAARLLLKIHGTEEAVKAWCEYHLNLTNNVLRRWYMTARIEAHEAQKQKGQQE